MSSLPSSSAFDHCAAQIWAALEGAQDALHRLEMRGQGALASVFPVSDLAAASLGVAGLAISELVAQCGAAAPQVVVDRRLASLWFGSSLHPLGWEMPALWDAVAGDYRTADGWIRLHTNAPHHRAAALAVLDAPADREAVATAVRRWTAHELESAVVAQGGCAAAMRGLAAWAAHPQGQAVQQEPLLAWQAHPQPGQPFSFSTGAWQPSAQRPLKGLRVLDLTRILAGPAATRWLAGHGAEVLRIDPPGWEEPGTVPEVTLGKRCARLDLRAPQDRACSSNFWPAPTCWSMVTGRCAGGAGIRGRVAPSAESLTHRCVAQRLWMERALAAAARLRQPGADERRHCRCRHAPAGP